MSSTERRSPKLADDFLVTVGFAIVDGAVVHGIGLWRKGDATLLFLATTTNDSAWLLLPISQYTATRNPIDETLIEGHGFSGHRYVVEKP